MNARGQEQSPESWEADDPTPPRGVPIPDDTATPPEGIEGLGELVTAEDFGNPSPTVLGGQEPVPERSDAGEWPTLEYRSRNKPERSSGRFGWLRRREEQ